MCESGKERGREGKERRMEVKEENKKRAVEVAIAAAQKSTQKKEIGTSNQRQVGRIQTR